MARATLDELDGLLATCARWTGRRKGEVVPCKSALIGRELDVKVRGHRGKTKVRVTGCAVPRSDRPSQQCRPDYRVEEVGALVPFKATVSGGTIRNASRTPREMHPGGPYEFINGRFQPGPRDFIELNRAEGLALLTGLDGIPYPHRAGSGICCPTHAANADRLRMEVQDADAEGEPLTAATRAGLARLAKHLRAKHSEAHPERYGPRDYSAAYAVTAAGDAWCAAQLISWQETQTERQALYREEKKRKAKRAKSRKASARKSRKTQVARGYARHQRYEQTQQRRAAKAAPNYAADLARINARLKAAA